MKPADALQRAKLCIQYNITHSGYEKTKEFHKLYTQLITGEDIDSLLPQFERRESPELWAQRKQLTVENLSPSIAPSLAKFYKVARVQVREEIKASTDADTKVLKELEESFYGQEDLGEYMTQVIDDMALLDPNAFLCLDFMPFDPTGYDPDRPDRPKPFPVIFDSSEVRDFRYNARGELDYLLVWLPSTIYARGSTATAQITDYYMFAAGVSYHFAVENPLRELGPLGNDYEDWNSGTVSLSNTGTQPTGMLTPGLQPNTYRIYTKLTGSKTVRNQVQAHRIGYKPYKNNRKICVSPIHPAIPHMRDLIRHKSGYDLSILLHVFPRLFQYGENCPGETAINPAYICDGGTIIGTGKTCTTCHGKGFKPHRSAQDVILMKYPTNGDNPIPLRDLAFYLSPDLNVIGTLNENLRELEQKVFVAIFSTDLLKRTSV